MTKHAKKGRQTQPIFSRSEVEVRSSAGKGRGVFALRNFKKDEVIEVAPVVEIPGREAGVVQFTLVGDYLFSGAYKEDGLETSYLALGYASLYNHSRQGNADYSITDLAIIIIANEDIAAGEEIMFDYGWEDEALKERGISLEA